MISFYQLRYHQIILLAFIYILIVITAYASDPISYLSLRQRREADSNQKAHHSRGDAFKQMEAEGVFSERALYHGEIPRTGRVGSDIKSPAPISPFPVPDNLTRQVTALAGFGILFQRINFVSAKTVATGGIFYLFHLSLSTLCIIYIYIYI